MKKGLMHKKVTVIEVPFGRPVTAEERPLIDEIGDLWAAKALGNDYYYYPFHADYDALEYPTIAEYIRANQIEGKVLLHYSW
jgi:hypothetical protein